MDQLAKSQLGAVECVMGAKLSPTLKRPPSPLTAPSALLAYKHTRDEICHAKDDNTKYIIRKP